jgi:hypothetical protein
MAIKPMTNSSVSGVLFAELVRLGVDPKLIGVDQPIIECYRNAPPALVVHSKASAAAMAANPGKCLESRALMPLLVIEIVTGGLIDPEKERTPTELHFADCVGEKVEDYFCDGVHEYWVVDTRGTSFAVFRQPKGYSECDECYALTEYRGDSPIVSPLFPGLKMTPLKAAGIACTTDTRKRPKPKGFGQTHRPNAPQRTPTSVA